MSSQKIYVIGNSHMDPIWLWRLREGRSTWLNTCRSVVRILKKYPHLKFSRSSSVCYRWIEESDPALFREIQELVEIGRWELVGGWVEQSDVIVTPGESLIRQAEHGKAYFQSRFGRDVRIAYCVDSFGQNAGLPKLLKATGFDYYVWMRPMQHEKAMPDIFRWQADDASGDIVSFRVREAYCTMPAWTEAKQLYGFLDKVIATGEPNQTFFFGIGDHGGGLYESQIQWLREAEDRYDLVYSTLDEYFKIIEKTDLPIVSGEHTHHAPGCYSAVGEVKEWMADAEKNLFKAEKIVLESRGQDLRTDTANLHNAWEELLFNYFHDVYPGTSAEATYRHEVRDLTGLVNKTAVDCLEKHLCRYASMMDTSHLTEGGVLLWNPLPHPVTALMRFDTFSDPNCHGKNFNQLIARDGATLPLQWIRAAANFGPNRAWGRATATVQLGPSEVKAFAYAYGEASHESVGFDRQYAALRRLRFAVLDDRFDTWAHEARSLGATLGNAEAVKTEELENGPVASRLRIHYRWNQSTFYLDLFAFAGIAELEGVWRANWQEPDGTLKLAYQMPHAIPSVLSGQACAVLDRPADDCEQPFIDWIGVKTSGGASGFLTHALHSYDTVADELRLTLCRPVLYAEHAPFPPHGDEGCADMGMVERRFWLFDTVTADANAKLSQIARERLWGSEHMEITQAADGRDFHRNQWEVTPGEVLVHAQRLNADGSATFHLENPTQKTVSFTILCNGKKMAAGVLAKAELRLLTV